MNLCFPVETDFLRIILSLFSSYRQQFSELYKLALNLLFSQPTSKGGQATQANSERWVRGRAPLHKHPDCLLGFWGN